MPQAETPEAKPGTPRPTMPEPGVMALIRWKAKGGCKATDGCWVEPDGECEHGHPSWLRYLGMI